MRYQDIMWQAGLDQQMRGQMDLGYCPGWRRPNCFLPSPLDGVDQVVGGHVALCREQGVMQAFF